MLFNALFAAGMKNACRFLVKSAGIRMKFERLFSRAEILFSGAAFRAAPIVRQVFKNGADQDFIVRIAELRIVDITAQGAFISVHDM